MNPSSRWGSMWQGARARGREIALIVVLVLVNYLIFSRLFLMVWGGAQPMPTVTRTPKPTFTPSDLGARTAGPTLTPSDLAIDTPTSLPEPTPTFEPAPAPSPTPLTHVVQPGDTLSGIARKYGITADALAQANDLEDADAIREGQVLLIPSPGAATTAEEEIRTPVPTPSSPVGQRIHVVQEGETLSEIARKYGVTAADIAQANGLDDPNAISAGQALVIP